MRMSQQQIEIDEAANEERIEAMHEKADRLIAAGRTAEGLRLHEIASHEFAVSVLGTESRFSPSGGGHLFGPCGPCLNL